MSIQIKESYLIKCNPPKIGAICIDPASTGWREGNDEKKPYRGHWGILFSTKDGLHCYTVYGTNGEVAEFIQRFIFTNTDPHEEDEAVIEEPVCPNIRLAGSCAFISGYLKGYGIKTRWVHPSNWALRAGVDYRKLGFKRYTPSEHIIDVIGMYFHVYGRIEEATTEKKRNTETADV
jgi:hypothetical protein